MPLLLASEIPKVGIVVFAGVELLDFSGPGEVFAAARAYRVFTVGESREPILSQGFLKVEPTYSLVDCPQPDILIIPGGRISSLLDSSTACAALAKRIEQAEIVLSVCNGAVVLAKLGLLDGLEATTHWSVLEDLQLMSPSTQVHADRRFVDNGKIVTAAGVSAGIDASLYVVARELGIERARSVARYMEYPFPDIADVLAEATLAAASESPVSEQRNEDSAAPLALLGLDPVLLCQGEESKGQKSLTADDGRYLYRFASQETHQQFLADRGRFGIQARGSCAGMGAKLEESSGSPDLFAVHEGLIYIFAGNGCRQDFLATPDAMVKDIRQAIKEQWSLPEEL